MALSKQGIEKLVSMLSTIQEEAVEWTVLELAIAYY